MPAQWIAVPFVRRDLPYAPSRYCGVDDFTAQIQADGGTWDSFECGGGPGTDYILGVCFAKVGGVTTATLALVAGLANALAIPTKLLELNTSMSVTTNAEKAFIRDQVGRRLGYSDQEIADWLGVAVGASTAQKNTALNAKTYGQFLDFLATRWFTPVFDSRNPPGPQVGWNGTSYDGFIAVDGRTVTGGTHPGASEQRSPAPVSPAEIAARVPST
jgi:hypothetical protein